VDGNMYVEILFHVIKIWFLLILLYLHGQITKYLRKQQTRCTLCLISEFHLDVGDLWPLLGYNAACSGNTSPTFRDKLSVPSSGIKNLGISLPLQLRPIGCPEKSVRNYPCMVRNSPEERRRHVVHYWKKLLNKLLWKKGMGYTQFHWT
jgi:hypothetical protein